MILARLGAVQKAVARQGGRLALLFLLFGLPAGAGLAWFTPLGDMPDEPAHMARAEGLLYGQLMGFRGPPPPSPGIAGAGVLTDASAIPVSIAELVPTLRGAPLPDAARARARAVRWGNQPSYFPTQMVQYFPAFYLPSAAGLWAGRAMGLSPLQAAFLARFFMLAAYLAMGWAALRLARFGQPLLFTLLLLPVSLLLGASLSQDGQLIAATALAAALLTRAGPKPGWGWAAALGLLVLVVCSKPSYAPFLGLCVLPLARPGLGARLGVCAAALALPLAWMRLMTSCCYTGWLAPPYHPGPLWPGAGGLTFDRFSAAGNLAVLRAHPLQALILPARLLLDQGGRLWREMIALLSAGGVHLPPWQVWGWSLALLGACMGCMAQPGPGPRPRQTGFVALLLAAAWAGVSLALYLSYTQVGAARIAGVNGRYLLLFWPALPFLLPRWRGRPWLAGAALFPALLMAALDVWALPAFTWQLYRMAGP